VNKTATLGGTLEVVRLGAFVPKVNDKFDAMTWTSRSGTFGTVTGLDLGTLAGTGATRMQGNSGRRIVSEDFCRR